MSLLNTLNAARLGLNASQTAMSIISNNIANVNTPGYHRQSVNLEPSNQGGVRVSGIARYRDEFVGSQVRSANAGLGAQTQLTLNLQQIQSILGDTQDNGLSPTMQEFFGALNDLTVNPAGSTERQLVRSSGEDLVAGFESISTQLGDLRKQLDREISAQVNTVNTILNDIARINETLTTRSPNAQVAAASGENYYQMLDRRDQLIDQLSSIVPVRSVVQDNGHMTLFMGNTVILDSTNVHELKLRLNSGNDGLYDVALADVAGNLIDIRPKLNGQGSLEGLLSSRDDHAGNALRELDRLSAQFMHTFNSIHSQGYGLDNVTGRNFFSSPDAYGRENSDNRGGLLVSSSTVTDPSQLTFDDYEIRFTTDNTYDVVNVTTGTSISSGNMYPVGGPALVNVDGIEIQLTEGPKGGPRQGDRIEFNTYHGASTSADLDPAILADLDAIAAAGPGVGGNPASAGDNSNALQLVALQNSTAMGSGRTFQNYYDDIRLNIASATARAQDSSVDAEIRQSQAKSMADAISGVSIDDEAIDIIQYQRSYQAASRIIGIVDELMNTLVNII